MSLFKIDKKHPYNYFYNILTTHIVFLLLLYSSSSYALYPRAYIAAPAGTFLLASYYYQTDSNVLYSRGNKLNVDTKASSYIGILRPIYYFDWLGKRFAVNTLIGFGYGRLSGQAAIGEPFKSSRLADPVLHGGFFLINDPANKLWLGISEYLSLPLGEYDKNKAINLGENRYKGKTELGLAKGLGNFYLDITTSMTLYGDNTDFGSNSSQLEQDVLWGLETHITRNITSSSYLGLGGLWQWGGKRKLNAIKLDDKQNKFALQISFNHNLGHRHKFGFYYKKDLEVENGFKLDNFSLRYVYVF